MSAKKKKGKKKKPLYRAEEKIGEFLLLRNYLSLSLSLTYCRCDSKCKDGASLFVVAMLTRQFTVFYACHKHHILYVESYLRELNVTSKRTCCVVS